MKIHHWLSTLDKGWAMKQENFKTLKIWTHEFFYLFIGYK
jgi:hypothetical protein